MSPLFPSMKVLKKNLKKTLSLLNIPFDYGEKLVVDLYIKLHNIHI